MGFYYSYLNVPCQARVQCSSELLYLLGGPRHMALATGAVVVIGDGDLLILLSLQLALVETQGTF